MPNLDGTGPNGQGSMTGRGLGPCGRGLARGSGFGRGSGRRMGFNCPYAKPTKEELQAELDALEQEKAKLQKELKALK